jgi:WD40 repeat protein
VNSLAFSPDGRMLAAGSWLDKTIVLWDMENPQRPGRRLTGHSEGVWSLAFSRDGKTLVSSSCCNKMEIRWWEVATEKPQPTALTVPVGNVSSVAFSPDGHTLALGTKGGDIILWDIEKHERLDQQLMGHSERVRSLGFSPDGQTLASVGQETVILTDMATGLSRDRWPLTGISYEEVWSVALSLDGQTLVLGGIADRPHRFEGVDFVGTITLWDVATRQRLGPPLTWHTEVVQSVIFSADGKRLASGGKDRIMLWDVSEESWQARACRIVNRNLTPEEWRQFLGEEPYRETCPNLP